MAGHCKGAAGRETLQGRACIRENDCSFGAVAARFVAKHVSRGLLTNQKRTERRIPHGFKRQARIRIGNPLSEYRRHPAVNVVHDKCWSAEIANNILEQQVDRCRLGRIASVSAHSVRFFDTLQGRLVRVPSGNTDPHAVFREQSTATGADARTATDDQCHVLDGGVGFSISGHALLSQA
jgi:hypothetical protein